MKFGSTSLRLVVEIHQLQSLPSPAKKSIEWVSITPALLAGVIVVLGWLVVERFARRREARTDLRAAVNSFTKAVDEIRVSSVTVYGLAGHDPQARSLSATIRAKISALSDQLTTLESSGLTGDHADLLKVFRQSVTGNDFESIGRQPLPATSPLFPEIAGNGEALARAIEIEMLSHLLKPRNRTKIGRLLGGFVN